MRIIPRTLFLFAVALTALSQCVSADTSNPVGTWHLNANGARVTAVFSRGLHAGSFSGILTDEHGSKQSLDAISWHSSSRRLEFRCNTAGVHRWYRGTMAEGVFVGRFSESPNSDARPERLEDYNLHVTGWNSTHLDRGLAPRVFELLLSNEFRARLRIDAAPQRGRFVGRMKIYSSVSAGASGEELEYDVEITKWDGKQLSFVRRLAGSTQNFTGIADGRSISGTYAESGKAGQSPWSGVRAEVLSYGLSAKSRRERAAWQERTRRQLFHLMMAGNPSPLSTRVTTVREQLPPLASAKYPAERDDDPGAWPQNYRLTELQFDFTLPNPYGGPPIARRAHAYLAVPSAPAIGGKYPAVLAVNGHGGSAWKMANPDDAYYWYGDAFARRGFVVLMLDISHRPLEDRRVPFMTEPLYSGPETGDDATHGNGPHPAIKAAGFDSDWEEDGERVWDAMRALDYLLAMPQVDASRVAVTGLSMGGTIAALVAALDPRVTLSLPAAPSSDFGVMFYKGNHSCWLWMHGDVREHFDAGDLFALTAPRPLVVVAGKTDATYSRFPQPFTSYKQIFRRARAAYGSDAANLVFHLHYDGHRFHVGDKNPTQERETGLQTPLLLTPEANGSPDWQTDSHTEARWPTLFDCMRDLWKRK